MTETEIAALAKTHTALGRVPPDFSMTTEEKWTVGTFATMGKLS